MKNEKGILPDMSRRTPFDGIEELFDRLEGELGDVGQVLETEAARGVKVDVVEHPDEIVIAADLPGYDSDDIDLSVSGGVLTISAETDRELAVDDEKARFHMRERRSRSATRRIRLPGEVEEEEASASYEDGVLTVTFPKRDVDRGEGTRIDVEDG